MTHVDRKRQHLQWQGNVPRVADLEMSDEGGKCGNCLIATRRVYETEFWFENCLDYTGLNLIGCN